MSATIFAFPAPPSAALCLAERRSLSCASIPADALATKFTDHFLPVVQAGMDLLQADERDFEARCSSMIDVEGTAMIDELCQEMEIVGQQMRLLADGLYSTRSRLRTAISRLSYPG